MILFALRAKPGAVPGAAAGVGVYATPDGLGWTEHAPAAAATFHTRGQADRFLRDNHHLAALVECVPLDLPAEDLGANTRREKGVA